MLPLLQCQRVSRVNKKVDIIVFAPGTAEDGAVRGTHWVGTEEQVPGQRSQGFLKSDLFFVARSATQSDKRSSS